MALTEGLVSTQLRDATILAADLAPGCLSADATGRALMATSYFDLPATVLGKFATDCFDNATLLQLVANAAFAARDATRALFAANFLGTTATARALVQTGFFDTATVLDKFAAGSFTTANLISLIPADAMTNAVLIQAVLDGAFQADADSRALFADQFVTGAKIANDTITDAVALAVHAADSFTNAVLLKAVVNDAFAADDATRALFAASFLGNTATGRALVEAGFFDAATVLDKFANASVTVAKLATDAKTHRIGGMGLDDIPAATGADQLNVYIPMFTMPQAG
ncbi:MAG: hypothetical protein ABII82_01935, partial [Verrucomicrobiota bacterium]